MKHLVEGPLRYREACIRREGWMMEFATCVVGAR